MCNDVNYTNIFRTRTTPNFSYIRDLFATSFYRDLFYFFVCFCRNFWFFPFPLASFCSSLFTYSTPVRAIAFIPWHLTLILGRDRSRFTASFLSHDLGPIAPLITWSSLWYIHAVHSILFPHLSLLPRARLNNRYSIGFSLVLYEQASIFPGFRLDAWVFVKSMGTVAVDTPPC